MDPVDQTLEQAIIAPLSNFLSRTSPMDATHQHAVRQFADNVGALFDAHEAFRGSAADAAAKALADYLQVENALTGTGVSERLHDANALCDTAIKSIQYAIDTHSLPWPGGSGTGIQAAGIVGAGAIGWGTLDGALAEVLAGSAMAALWIPVAIVAAGTASWAMQRKLDEIKDAALALAVLVAGIQALTQVNERALPAAPTKTILDTIQTQNNGNQNDPNKRYTGLKIAVTIAVGAGALHRIFDQLSKDEQDRIIRALMKETGCNESAIRALIAAYPGLTVDTYLQVLTVQQTIQLNEHLKSELNTKKGDPRYQDPEVQKSIDQMRNEIDNDVTSLKKLEQRILDGKGPDKLEGRLQGYNNRFQGKWAEWKLAEYYGDRGKLLFFDRSVGGKEIDVAIRDGNNIRLIEIKAYKTSFGVTDPTQPKLPDGSDPPSEKFKELGDQLQNTLDLNNPSMKASLKKQYKYRWFDEGTSNIDVEVDLVNRNPLGPGQGWTKVADELRNRYPGIKVHTTDKMDPTLFMHDKNYEQDNPFNDEHFWDTINKPPDLQPNWCAPIDLKTT